MRHSDYWRKRFEQLEEAQNKQGAAYYAELEKQYKLASNSIEHQIASWYVRFAKNNEISYAEAKVLLNSKELKEFRWTVEDYIKKGKENAISGEWMKQLENASAKVHVSRLEALKLQLQNQCEVLFGNQVDGLDKTLTSIYKDSYYRTAYEIQRGLNVGYDFHKLNETGVKAVISKPWTADGSNFVNRCWTAKKQLVDTLHTELTQAIIRGDAPDKAIETIARKFDVSKSNAGRLVMTESAFFASAAQQDCFNALDVEKYEIVATLDRRTSPTCRHLDGKVFEMKDRKVGVTAPPFHCWCRSCTAPYFADDTSGERAARDENGKTYYVPDSMKYGDWEKAFVEGGPKTGLQEVAEDGIKKVSENLLKFREASTIRDANDYAAQTLGVKADYKGCDITSANEWNRGVTDYFNDFPELKNNFGFIGECRQRNTAVKPVYATKRLEELQRMNLGVDPGILQRYVDKDVRSFMKRMSVSKRTMAESWSPTSKGLSDYKGICINADFAKNSAKLIESLKIQVEKKWHPIGTETIRSILDHEMGHQLDDLLGISKVADIQKLFDSRTSKELTNDLSEYAWNNKSSKRYSEMIAEAWAEYCSNPNPREIAKMVGETIKQEYNKKFVLDSAEYKEYQAKLQEAAKRRGLL